MGHFLVHLGQRWGILGNCELIHVINSQLLTAKLLPQTLKCIFLKNGAIGQKKSPLLQYHLD